MYTREEMQSDMIAEMIDLLGTGYIPDYYKDMAQGFISIAEAYAEAQRGIPEG